MDFRVRRWPSKVLHGEPMRTVITPGGGAQQMVRVPAAKGGQMILDEGAGTEMLPAPKATAAGKPDVFALWWRFRCSGRAPPTTPTCRSMT
jgi:hypothetical protein